MTEATWSLWKQIKLAWHMRKVRGGYRRGEPREISAAFVKAGIVDEGERPQIEEHILRHRLADGFKALADAMRRERD